MRHIAIADIDRALWEEALVCLFAISHDRELMPLVDIVRRVAPDVLTGDARAQAAPRRPGRWPDLLAAGLDRLAAATLQRPADFLGLRRPMTYRDAVLDLARRLGASVPDAAPIAAVEGMLIAALEQPGNLARVPARPDLAARSDLVEAVLEVARLRARKRKALGLDPRSSPEALRAAVREAKLTERRWLAQLGASTFLRLDDLLQRIPGGAQLPFARLPPCNILVSGKSGVGKSTLINAVFGQNVAMTGVGRPITQKAAWYEAEGFPVRLMDTRGLEPGAYQPTRDALRDAIREAQASDDPERQLHLVWHCIDEGGGCIEATDVDFAHMLRAAGVPAICVLTKAWGEINLEAEARRQLPDPPVRSIVRVIAARRVFASGLVREPMGLDRLITETERLLPEGFRGAFIAAQNVVREPKIRQARRVINAAAASAAAAATTPVPFTSAILLVPIQMSMVFSISRAVGLDLNEQAIKPVLGAALGALATTFTGRFAAATLGELLKGLPGVGSMLGGALDAAVAGSLTKALGEGYLDFLTGHIRRYGEWPSTSELVNFFKHAWLKRNVGRR